MELNVRRLLSNTFISLAMLSLCLDISNCNRNSQIPMSMYKKQSRMRSTADFVNEMIKQRPSASYSQEANRPGGLRKMESQRTGSNDNNVSIMANQIATQDACDPRPRSVPIPPDSDPRVMLWPTCTKLDRCGECCGHDLLECAPTNTESVTVQVMKQRMNSEDSSRFDYMGNVEVTLERHLACECRCKMKAQDCNPANQVYDEASCMCKCRNAGQATSCQNPKKWEEKHCRCVCPNLINCLDDEYFDFNTCSCVRRPPEQITAPGANHPVKPADPCSGTYCRTGFAAQLVGSRCLCRRVRMVS